ncbi:MAG: hypothetical protein PVF17_04970 [Ignavibacteria bacterium]
MGPYSNEEIIKKILSYFTLYGENYYEWFAGASTKPLQTLFEDHNVDPYADDYIILESYSTEDANAILKSLNEMLGIETGDFVNNSSVNVYVYKKTSKTTQ